MRTAERGIKHVRRHEAAGAADRLPGETVYAYICVHINEDALQPI